MAFFIWHGIGDETTDTIYFTQIWNLMFRIKKAFENDFTVIFNVEGEVKDEFVDDWTKEISGIVKEHPGQVIFNFCRVSYISANATRVLSMIVPSNVHIMNGSRYMKNLLTVQGASLSLLD